MGNFKGSGILALKKIFEKYGPEAEAAFRARLTPEEDKLYKTILAITWVPSDIALSITQKAADTLFPNDAMNLFKIGQARANIQINGVYKLFFKILNIPTILGSAAQLWPAQHDHGKAWIETGQKKNQAQFCVSDYPDILQPFLEIVRGFIHGVMSAAGAKNIKIMLDKSNPSCWRWSGTWE